MQNTIELRPDVFQSSSVGINISAFITSGGPKFCTQFIIIFHKHKDERRCFNYCSFGKTKDNKSDIEEKVSFRKFKIQEVCSTKIDIWILSSYRSIPTNKIGKKKSDWIPIVDTVF